MASEDLHSKLLRLFNNYKVEFVNQGLDNGVFGDERFEDFFGFGEGEFATGRLRRWGDWAMWNCNKKVDNKIRH
jgi:hypothetical protein